MTDFYHKNIVEKVNEHHKNIMPKMYDLNNKFKRNNKNIIYDKYYRYLKKPKKITENGYITIIFANARYLPGILVSGYFIKYICKSKYDIICLVQDNPYYEIDQNGNKILKFQGLTENEIEDIKKIYDVVIGIDILKLSSNKVTYVNNPQYKNMIYYCTKLLVLGLTQYKKLICYDSSTIIMKNIDYYFTKYNRAMYRTMYPVQGIKRGITANIFLFSPKKYYLEKSLYLLNNYNKYFLDLIQYYTNDENIFYYTIFPDWDYNKLDETKFEDAFLFLNPKIDINYDNSNYEAQLNVGYKPFMYPYNIDLKNKDKFSIDFYCYNVWDIAAKKLLKKFKTLNKYFEHIKTYRYTKF